MSQPHLASSNSPSKFLQDNSIIELDHEDDSIGEEVANEGGMPSSQPNGIKSLREVANSRGATGSAAPPEQFLAQSSYFNGSGNHAAADQFQQKLSSAAKTRNNLSLAAASVSNHSNQERAFN